MASTQRTIKQDTIALLTRKRPMTYEAMVSELQKRHPDCSTSVKTVQWYASRLRADGTEVNVKRANDRRNWGTRSKADASQRTH
jgi:hypothetical protein